MQSNAALRKITSVKGKIEEMMSEIEDVVSEMEQTCPFYLRKEQQCAICLTLQQRGHEARCCMFNEDYSVCSMYHVGTGQRSLNLMYEALD
jgi:hypothetical protein